MSKPLLWILTALFALAAARAESPGARALGLGREAVARGAALEGIAKLAEAAALLDPEREREALAEAYFELGLAYAGQGGSDESALVALARSASLAARPGNAYLWAATVAGRLGLDAEAATLRAQAMAALTPPAAPAAPAPTPLPVAPAPAAPAAPAEEKPGAFEHFFGARKEVPAPTAAPPAPSAPAPSSPPPE